MWAAALPAKTLIKLVFVSAVHSAIAAARLLSLYPCISGKKQKKTELLKRQNITNIMQVGLKVFNS